MRCLAELCAYINQALQDGATPLYVAAQDGHFDVVRCLVKAFAADINQAAHNGLTPLMTASFFKHADIVTWLVKEGADPQTSTPQLGTAADLSKAAGASVEQIEYLESKAHCSNPGCSGPGLKKCQGCKQARYCGQACQLTHWPSARG